MQPKFLGICRGCFQCEQCAMDAGYDWTTGRYEMTDNKTFNADYYATLVAGKLDDHWQFRAMGSQSKRRFADAMAKVVKKCIDANPNAKPDFYEVRAGLAEELKGFIPAFILVAVFGWAIQRLLDFIFDNWTAMPNGEPKP